MVDKSSFFVGWGTGILNLFTNPQADLESEFKLTNTRAIKIEQHIVLLYFYGWGTGIRTPEMSESESDALPLGDAPKYSIDLDDLCIISKRNRFVNSFFKKI